MVLISQCVMLSVAARMGANKLCITTGGDLPANYIIHLAAAHDSRSWKTVIANCLQEAEAKRFTNIAFPLLGTGRYYCSLLANDSLNKLFPYQYDMWI